MGEIVSGEYDNYYYRLADEMTITEQIDSANKALKSAMSLSRTNKSDDLDNIIMDIKRRLQQLEAKSAATGGGTEQSL